MQTIDRFYEFRERLVSDLKHVDGYLGAVEIHFLALLGAHPTAVGEVLEIGSFKGKSTIVLAKAAQLANTGRIYAVDPMFSPSVTDPEMAEGEISLDDFRKNLAEHDCGDRVELYQMRSKELAGLWDKPVRLLWIDGDHTYEGAKTDFDGFRDHLADGAIVAIHDVLHEFDGALRVFMENILLSPNFGACGVVGSIGWAQFSADKNQTLPFQDQKLVLYKKLGRLVAFVAFGKKLRGLEKKKYKLFRSRVPRRAIEPEKWLDQIKVRI
ncbi:MAG: class I SAM-dependent methyltransferase [Acidobacteriota bacterium]|nr:class I SAM-dependent methyltransferase [Acidobacteriota bacterium]